MFRFATSFLFDIDIPKTELAALIHCNGSILLLRLCTLTHKLSCCNRMSMTTQHCCTLFAYQIPGLGLTLVLVLVMVVRAFITIVMTASTV